MRPFGPDDTQSPLWIDKMYQALKDNATPPALSCSKCEVGMYIVVTKESCDYGDYPNWNPYLCDKCYREATGRDRRKLMYSCIINEHGFVQEGTFEI